MDYATYIREAVLAYGLGEPILTKTIAERLANESVVSMKEARNLVAVNVARLVEEGIVARFCNGIVYQPERSVFGELPLDPSTLINLLYIGDGKNVRGYVTGAAFLHVIGLCTWMPAEMDVATNANLRDRKAGLLKVRLVKPKVTVTAENAAYLQVLDAVRDCGRLSIDCDDPDRLITDYVRKHLDYVMLVAFASKYYSSDIVLKMASLAERVMS